MSDITYLSLEAELHDAFWSEEGPAAELPLIESFLDRHPGKALEIGAGSGRLLFPLIKKGYDIEGLELSPDMLRLARESAVGQNLQPIFHEANLDDFSLDQKYSTILIPAFTLQLSADPRAALQRIYDHLTPDGALYLTTFIPWSEIVGETQPDTWEDDNAHNFPDGRAAISRTKMSIDRISQKLTRHHHYRLFGKKDKLLAEHRSVQKLTWFWQSELQLLLEAIGYQVKSIIHDFAPQVTDETDPYVLTFEAVK